MNESLLDRVLTELSSASGTRVRISYTVTADGWYVTAKSGTRILAVGDHSYTKEQAEARLIASALARVANYAEEIEDLRDQLRAERQEDLDKLNSEGQGEV
jgi:hypothetical protein